MISLRSIANYFTSAFTFAFDGGFAEAALMGALVGGGTSLLTGKNPLSGALLGGLTGGAMNGISGAFGASTAAGATDQVLASNALENGTTSFLDSAGNLTPALNTTVADAGSVLSSNPNIVSSAMSGADAYGSSLANSGMIQGANGTFYDAQYLADNPAIQQTANQAVNQGAQQAANQGIEGVAKSKGFLGPMKDWWGGLSNVERAGVGIGGGVGLHYLMQPPKMVDPNIGKNNYKGPKLHDLSPDFQATDTIPNVYQPRYAEGGIAGLANGGMGTQGMGNNQGYPGGRLDTTQFATPTQMPTSTPVIDAGYEQKTDPYSGEPTGYAQGGVTRMASGGIPSGSLIRYDNSPTGNMSYINGGYGWAAPYYAPTPAPAPAPAPAAPAGIASNYNAPAPTQQVYQPNYGMLNTGSGNAGGVSALPSGYHGLDYNPATAPAPQVAQAAIQAIGNPQSAMLKHYAQGGGIGDLGGYAAGGNPRLLNGPGDGMSDSIPATIGGRQPARLAQGEFVVPADVVSHLGNGSTDAGAKHLYAMMDKVRRARTGNVKQGKQINPNKFLPA